MQFLRKINRDVLLYILSDSFYYAGYGVLNAFLSLLVTVQITHRVDMAGYVIAYYMIIRSLAELPCAGLVKRWSFRRRQYTVLACYLIYGCSIMLMGFSVTILQILILQTVNALADALAYPIRWPIFTRIMDEGNEEVEWSTEDVLSTAFPALFTILAGVLAQQYGVRATFLLFGPLLILAGIIFMFIKVPEVTSPQSLTP